MGSQVNNNTNDVAAPDQIGQSFLAAMYEMLNNRNNGESQQIISDSNVGNCDMSRQKAGTDVANAELQRDNNMVIAANGDSKTTGEWQAQEGTDSAMANAFQTQAQGVTDSSTSQISYDNTNLANVVKLANPLQSILSTVVGFLGRSV